MAVKLLITDFDGTLVNTFTANYKAYKKALGEYGINLTREKYRECFGFRFDRLMDELGVNDENIRKEIKEKKAQYYPGYFADLQLNKPLMDFIKALHQSGVKTAIASTARRVNLINVLEYLGETTSFDLILAGEEVAKGKPDPEIYLNTMQRCGVMPEETLVFEDSSAGMEAAERAGINYIKITDTYWDNVTLS